MLFHRSTLAKAVDSSPAAALWQPTASLSILKARADLIWKIHQFFRARDVLAVETPLLSRFATTDPHLTPFACQSYDQASSAPYFLCTSPEFPMKRLLCAYAHSIYQITKAFRAGDCGKIHNPEFTMLEWYRLDLSPQALMQETIDLLSLLYEKNLEWEEIRYQALFQQIVQIDPLSISIDALKALSEKHGLHHQAESPLDRSTYLNFLFSTLIEPDLGQNIPIFVTHFPAEQALLARADPDCDALALRFELYHRGVELANGFVELQDPTLLSARMQRDNAELLGRGRTPRPRDLTLIEAHEAGLPDCCGIALGIDRLFMQVLSQSSIREVISFPYERA